MRSFFKIIFFKISVNTRGQLLMQKITSTQNAYIKWVKSLLTKKGRMQEGKFTVEGIKTVREAIAWNAKIHSIVVDEKLCNETADLLEEMERREVPVYVVDERVMEAVTETKTPQGIVGVVHKPCNEFQIEDYAKHRNDADVIVLAIDRLQDPGNLGTIIRTADAVGIHSVLLSKGTVELFSPKVIRSTMGSIFHIPVFCEVQLGEELSKLKEQGFFIIASHLKGENFFRRPQIKKPVVLIIGNEANGIDDKITGQADRLYKLPMAGKAESLNASIAAGVMIYDIAREWLKEK